MTQFFDYDSVGQAICDLLTANIPTLKAAFYEPDMRDENFAVMPAAFVFLDRIVPEVRAGNSYYSVIEYEIVVQCVDLSSYKAASAVRSSLVGAIQDVIRANMRFHIALETTKLGQVDFLRSTDEDTGAFTAEAQIKIACEAYND